MAQKRVEGYNFDMRKQLLDYDDVLRRQREIIYAQRNRILEADEVHDMVRVVFEKQLNKLYKLIYRIKRNKQSMLLVLLNPLK